MNSWRYLACKLNDCYIKKYEQQLKILIKRNFECFIKITDIA